MALHVPVPLSSPHQLHFSHLINGHSQCSNFFDTSELLHLLPPLPETPFFNLPSMGLANHTHPLRFCLNFICTRRFFLSFPGSGKVPIFFASIIPHCTPLLALPLSIYYRLLQYPSYHPILKSWFISLIILQDS